MATRIGRAADIPLYAMRCPSGHSFDVFGRMADPPHHATCECGDSARRDYQAERKQVGFVDGISLAHLPKGSGAPLADPGNSTKRVIKNKHDWTELCKKNDWTDVSNNSGPPE